MFPSSKSDLFVGYFIEQYAADKAPDQVEAIRKLLWHSSSSDRNIFERYAWGRAFSHLHNSTDQLERLLQRKLKIFDIVLQESGDASIANLCYRAGRQAETLRWDYAKQTIAGWGYDVSAPEAHKLIKERIEQDLRASGREKDEFDENDLIQIISPYASFDDRRRVVRHVAVAAFFTSVIAAPILGFYLGATDKIKADNITRFWLATSVTIEMWGVFFVSGVLILAALGKTRVLDKVLGWNIFYAIALIAIMSFVQHLAFPAP